MIDIESYPGNPARAHAFTVPNIILDPAGHLTRLRREVSKHFDEKKWILKRCENAKKVVLGALERSKNPPNDPKWNNSFVERIHHLSFWGLIPFAQIPCIAGLSGTTVRKAFVASRKTLEKYGEDKLFSALLEILGSERMSEGQVRTWIQNAIENDASPKEKKEYQQGYHELLSALGCATETDLNKKIAATERLIPEVMNVAERIAGITGK